MRIAVIGAGPAGLTAAYRLTKTHPNVDVYEGSESVGGLAKSLKLWGQTVDLGPHRFFSTNKRVNELWLEVVGPDYAIVERKTRILYKGDFYEYPLQLLDTLRKLGLAEAVRCVLSYAREQFQEGEKEETFETWVRSRFGGRLYEIFFKAYSEKLWGIPCSELDADFAAQRIRQFSLPAAIVSALSVGVRHSHRTLVDRFAYPIGGTGMVYSRMEAAINERGGRVLLKTPVKGVVVESGRIKAIELCDGSVRDYDRVISSMPLTSLVAKLQGVPIHVLRASAQLGFRHTILVYVEVASDCVNADNWIYVHSPDLQTGRITNFRNWVPQLCAGSRHTVLAMEYWCSDGDDLSGKNDNDLIQLACRELVASNLVKSRSLILNAMVYRIPKCYPVYRKGYKTLLQPIKDYVSNIQGLQVIGRYGAFKYNNQDHSILMGILAADNILKNGTHDLWGVNTDYETYQEKGSIADLGLAHKNEPMIPSAANVGLTVRAAAEIQ